MRDRRNGAKLSPEAIEHYLSFVETRDGPAARSKADAELQSQMAEAQSMLEDAWARADAECRFGLSLEDTSLPPLHDEAPRVSADRVTVSCFAWIAPETPFKPESDDLSLVEARAGARFRVRWFTSLPAWLGKAGWTVPTLSDGDGGYVVMARCHDTRDAEFRRGLFLEQALRGWAAGHGPFPRAVAAEVMIGEQRGVYVSGAWAGDGRPWCETDGRPVWNAWDAARDCTWLSWDIDGVRVTLAAVGLSLSREELVRLAVLLT